MSHWASLPPHPLIPGAWAWQSAVVFCYLDAESLEKLSNAVFILLFVNRHRNQIRVHPGQIIFLNPIKEVLPVPNWTGHIPRSGLSSRPSLPLPSYTPRTLGALWHSGEKVTQVIREESCYNFLEYSSLYNILHTQGECHVTLKGKVKVVLPQAQERWDCRPSTGSWGGARKRPFPTASAGTKENTPPKRISFIFILWHRTVPLRVPPTEHFHKKRWQETGGKKLLLKKKENELSSPWECISQK